AAVASDEQCRAGREPCEESRLIRAVGDGHAHSKNGKARAFQSGGQGWFLQLLGEVAIEFGTPSNNRLQRQTIYLRIGSGGAGRRTTLVERCKVGPSRSRARDLPGGIKYVLKRVDITRMRAGVDW